MKQDVNAASDKQEKTLKTAKAEKNLYDPYVTPSFLYEAMRWVVIVIFSIAGRVHLRGRQNVPTKGPYIIASNHLSWTDIPLVPAYLPGKVIYMAKEEAFL